MSAEDNDYGRVERELRFIFDATNEFAQIQKGSFLVCTCLPNGMNEFSPKRNPSLLGSRSDDVLIIASFVAKFRARQPSVNPGEQQQFSGLSLPLSAIEAIECSSPVRFESMEHNWFSSPFVTLSPEKHAGCCLKGIEKAIGPWISWLSVNQQSAMTILSFIKSEIRTNIVIELFSVIRISHAPQPIAIAARVAPLGSHSQDRREFQGQLEIHAADLPSMRLPLKFTFGFLPRQSVIGSDNNH
jgi:hypothetical protein